MLRGLVTHSLKRLVGGGGSKNAILSQSSFGNERWDVKRIGRLVAMETSAGAGQAADRKKKVRLGTQMVKCQPAQHPFAYPASHWSELVL